MAKKAAKQNLRNTKPYSLASLTPEEALRKLMSAPKPDDEPEAKKKPAKGKQNKKK